jgi:adenylate cyclase
MNATGPDAAPRILVVDDTETNRRLLEARLLERGYRVSMAHGGLQGLAMAKADPPDLILLDVMMPDLDGFQVCTLMRQEAALEAVAIVMVTSLDQSTDRMRGLEVGADDFITRPFIKEELWARVRSLLRVKRLVDESRRQQAELAAASEVLARRVEETTREVTQLLQLKRFFSPALAARLVASQLREEILQSHRRDVTVLFADLRGFSAFAERASASCLMAMLRSFHAAMGELVFAHEGTLERFTGDGFMVFFNDPDPQPDHSLKAVQLALAMRERAGPLLQPWQAQGGPSGLGLGISRGEATVGAIGFEGRLDYAAIGSVTNRAARLCNAARPGEILVCAATWSAIHERVSAGQAQLLDLRGFAPDQPAYPIHVKRRAINREPEAR